MIAASSRAIAMHRLGHYDAATTMLTRTALSLDPGHGNPGAPVLAAYGSLLCTAAYASAQNGRRHQALDLISEAGAAAARMPAGRLTQPAFSVAGVDVYQIGIHNALGDSAAALSHARAVDQAQLPTRNGTPGAASTPLALAAARTSWPGIPGAPGRRTARTRRDLPYVGPGVDHLDESRRPGADDQDHRPSVCPAPRSCSSNCYCCVA